MSFKDKHCTIVVEGSWASQSLMRNLLQLPDVSEWTNPSSFGLSALVFEEDYLGRGLLIKTNIKYPLKDGFVEGQFFIPWFAVLGVFQSDGAVKEKENSRGIGFISVS